LKNNFLREIAKILWQELCHLSINIIARCKACLGAGSPLFKTLLLNKESQTTGGKWTLKSLVDADFLTVCMLRDTIKTVPVQEDHHCIKDTAQHIRINLKLHYVLIWSRVKIQEWFDHSC
jgi:hypothetical protein